MGNKGFSPLLPLTSYPSRYLMIDDFATNIKQNLKNLILTIPGERVMMPDFGVGLKQYLFEHDKINVSADIETEIVEAIDEYMPFVEIVDIDFPLANNGEFLDEENFIVIISYFIPALNLQDNLIIT